MVGIGLSPTRSPTREKKIKTNTTVHRSRVSLVVVGVVLCLFVLFEKQLFPSALLDKTSGENNNNDKSGGNLGDMDTPVLLVQDTPEAAAAAAAPKSQIQTNDYYDESEIIKLSNTLVKARQTVVTAYFRVPSKHSSDNYKIWMQNMLSLQDPMVIFLSPSLIPEIQALRQHALNRTVIIPMEVGDVPLAKQYDIPFWEHQLDIDPEKKIHKSYYVFWIWLSKSWWVAEAIRHNYFDSEVFVWSDMGCFRNPTYNGKEMVQHIETIPRKSMVFLAHHPTNPPPERIWNNKYNPATKKHFYHSGSMMAGYADTFQRFHNHFLEIIEEFLKKDMFIGEDQTVMQSTCMMHPDLCAYVSASQVKDNFYFGLRYILHYGGNYNFWYPPALESVTS